jgi:hypothetical protein
MNWNEVWFTNCPMVSANNVDLDSGRMALPERETGTLHAGNPEDLPRGGNPQRTGGTMRTNQHERGE